MESMLKHLTALQPAVIFICALILLAGLGGYFFWARPKLSRAWRGLERFAALENERAWKVSIEQIKAANYNLDQKNPHAPEQESHDPDELLRRYASLQKDAQGLRNQLKAILTESLSGARA